MKVLTVSSAKGGVGKTTLALNTSFALARRDWRVLLVDTDPQGGIGLSLNKRVAKAAGLSEYAQGKARLPDLMVKTRVEGFTLLPVGQVRAKESIQFGEWLADGGILQGLIADASAHTDIVVFDTPSGFSGPSRGALKCATHVVSPLQAEPIALRAVDQLLEMLSWLRDGGADISLAGLVITMLQLRNQSSLAIAEEVWGNFPTKFLIDVSIPRDPVFLEASAAGVPVGLLRRPVPPASSVFDMLAIELERRMQLDTGEASDGPIPLVD